MKVLLDQFESLILGDLMDGLKKRNLVPMKLLKPKRFNLIRKELIIYSSK
ncbi:MAG: hypothetical protein AAFY45_27250 [Bacteroidota bacterium]